MTVKTHITTSAILAGILFYITSSVTMSMAALFSGVLIDLDHLMDFLLLSGEKFSIKNMFGWCNEGRWERIILIFHSYELYIVYAVIVYIYPYQLLQGILYGVGLHLILDQVGNRYLLKSLSVHPLFYFLAFRAKGGFRKERLRTDKTIN